MMFDAKGEGPTESVIISRALVAFPVDDSRDDDVQHY